MQSYEFSLVASTIILVAAVLMSLLRWFQCFLYREEVSWKMFTNLLVITATMIGLSISLLVYGVLRDEKSVMVLLLLYGRVLIITQVRFAWKILSVAAYKYLSLIFLGTCCCFLGSTILIVHQIFQGQSVRIMLQISMGLFSVEFLGLFVAYIWIIVRFNEEVWYEQRLMLLALGVAGCGMLTAFVPFLVNVAYRIDWRLAFWIHIAGANLWVGREIAIALLELHAIWRREEI